MVTGGWRYGVRRRETCDTAFVVLPYLILLAVCHASAHHRSQHAHFSSAPISLFFCTFFFAPSPRHVLASSGKVSNLSAVSFPLLPAFFPSHTWRRNKAEAGGPRRGRYRPFIVSELRSSCRSAASKTKAEGLWRAGLCERKRSGPSFDSQRPRMEPSLIGRRVLLEFIFAARSL